MKIIYLFMFLLRNGFSTIVIINTDSNETVAKFANIRARFGVPFSDDYYVYIFESNPLLACDDKIDPPFIHISNSSDIKLFVLIKRGNCTFEQKVAVAQNSGYTGVVIYNNNSEDIFQMSVGDASIPACMVSLRSGRILRSSYTFTRSRQNFILNFRENYNVNPQYYIIAFLGCVSLGFFLIGISFGIKICRDAFKRRANRLRQCHLKKIPIKKFVKGTDPYESCAICLEDFKDGEKLRILPCNHAYHSICVDPWLLKQKRNCPICKCRIKIPGRDEDSDCNDGPSSQTNVSNEHTPLINSRATSLPNYTINVEPDVQFIPPEQQSNTATIIPSCYDNLSFNFRESPNGALNNNKSDLSVNNDQSNKDEKVDPSKLV